MYNSLMSPFDDCSSKQLAASEWTNVLVAGSITASGVDITADRQNLTRAEWDCNTRAHVQRWNYRRVADYAVDA